MADHASTSLVPGKRAASSAGLKDKRNRPVKRRASKACQCCRARKVRCNVVEHGAPCTNCRLDEVDCIVGESKRKRKALVQVDKPPIAQNDISRLISSRDVSKIETGGAVDNSHGIYSPVSHWTLDQDEHEPHTLYQTHSDIHDGSESLPRTNLSAWNSVPQSIPPVPLFNRNPSLMNESRRPFLTPNSARTPSQLLPYYIKPLPPRIGADDVAFLEKKNALWIPPDTLRDAILRCYFEFVHPFNPIIDMHELLQIVAKGDGSLGRISLLLFQAVMFAGSAFVDMSHLKKAGYPNRKEARKAFFHRARLLYDFDYENDRVTLVQASLLMTYWYGSPDDQKDTWHWMGLATSWAHSIGLHRNPAKTNMDAKRRGLCKRLWWSCVIRDRLVALGMRRPTRIKSEDCDVPMLLIDDFEIQALPAGFSGLSDDFSLAKDVDMQRSLAEMCIAKAELCNCITHILNAVYSVPDSQTGRTQEGNTKATTLLFPKRLESGMSVIKACHRELQDWLAQLPESSKLDAPQPDNVTRSDAPVILNRSTLHMVYYTTLSALHGPQVRFAVQKARDLHHKLTEDSGIESDGSDDHFEDWMETSKECVQTAATEITRLGRNLLELGFVRFLPTTGVTAFWPALLNHLLDMKSHDDEKRLYGLGQFSRCVQIMTRLRDCYPSADYTMAFFELVIRRAEIKISDGLNGPTYAQNTEDLLNAALRQNLVAPLPRLSTASVTPSTAPHHQQAVNELLTDQTISKRLEEFLATTPPASDLETSPTESSESAENEMDHVNDMDHDPDDHFHNIHHAQDPMDLENHQHHHHMLQPDAFDRDFEALVNVEDFGDGLWDESVGAGLTGMHGESSGFTYDVDWMNPYPYAAGTYDGSYAKFDNAHP